MDLNIETLAGITEKSQRDLKQAIDKLEKVIEKSNSKDREIISEDLKKILEEEEKLIRQQKSLYDKTMQSMSGQTKEDANALQALKIEIAKLSLCIDDFTKLKTEVHNRDDKKRFQKQIDDSQKKIEDIKTDINKKYGTNSVMFKAISSFVSKNKTELDAYKASIVNQEKIKEKEEEIRRLSRENEKILERRAKAYSNIKAIAKSIGNEIKAGANVWLNYNEQAISDAKKLGLTTKEATLGYQKAMMANSQELLRDFAVTQEQAKKMQESFVKSIGRAAILSQEQLKDIAASSKIIGFETTANAISEMDKIGMSSQAAIEAIDKAYANALNTGLNAVQTSEVFVKNLSLANKLTFQNGVDGIAKMTAYSQKIKLDLMQVDSVAQKFSTIEGAIQGSAQLQVLGGPVSALAGNPMQMMYEAQSNAEDLFKRVAKMASYQAVFNKETGESTIDPLQLAIMKEQAKALSISADEFIQSAKRQAAIGDISNAMASNSIFNNATEEQKSKVQNIAQYNKEKQRWEVSFLDDFGEQTKGLNEISPSELNLLMRDRIDPVKDIRSDVRRIATILTGTKERWDSMAAQIRTGEANAMHGAMSFGDSAINKVNESSIWEAATTTTLGLITLGSLSALGKYGIGRFNDSRFSANNLFMKRSFGGSTSGGGATPPPSTPPPTTPPPATPGSGSSARGSRWVKIGRGLKGAKLTGVPKALGVLGIGLEAYNAYSTFSDSNEEQRREYERISGLEDSGQATSNEADNLRIDARNRSKDAKAEAIGGLVGGVGAGMAAGAMLGSVVPVVGTLIGGLIGGAIGHFAGGKIAKAAFGGKEVRKDDYSLSSDRVSPNEAVGNGNFDKSFSTLASIESNVSVIAEMMSKNKVSTISINNDEVQIQSGQVKVVPIEAGVVSPHDINSTDVSASNTNTEPLALNVTGSIDLNIDGKKLAGISKDDLVKLLLNDTDLQSKLTEVVSKRQSLASVGGRPNNERASNRYGWGNNQSFVG